jgi:hypothetical protein
MSDEKAFGSFEEFWPSYVRAHASKTNRTLHFIGTTAAMACIGGAIVFRKPKLLLLAPVVGYGPAWIGHFFVEHNKPATFGNPIYSLRGDLLMWKKTLDGTMDAEVERMMAMQDEAPAASPPAPSTNDARVASEATN